jgi:hypothetical protein
MGNVYKVILKIYPRMEYGDGVFGRYLGTILKP